MDYYNSNFNETHFDNNVISMSDNTSLKNKKKKSTKGKSACASVATQVIKLSTDPQSVAARERRHRISERFKTLQSLVPGGAKLDTVSMLDEAIHYVKFLKTQIWLHETLISSGGGTAASVSADSNSFQQQAYMNELHYFHQSNDQWSQYSSVHDGSAAFAVGQSSSWGYDNMDEVQFGY